MADLNNCLTNNSLCHYIESNSVQKFCIPSNLSNSINFTSICLNIRSTVNKEHFNVFQSWIQSLKLLPDILAINESWEKKSCIGQFRNLKHYKYISNFSQNLRGGGVALYMKKEIKYVPRYDLTHTDEENLESLFIDIQLSNEKMTYRTVYRLPKQDKSSNERFKLKLRDVLNAIKV